MNPSKNKAMPLILETSTPKPSIWQRQLFASQKLKLKERQRLYQQWSILLKAGLSIIDCLDILIGQVPSAPIEELLSKLKSGLEKGESLSNSFAAQGDQFTAFEQHSIRIGEQTGQLGQVLAQLASFYEKRLGLRRKMIQALSYPLVVILIAVGVVAFMLGTVVPMFEDIFNRFDATLPGITQAIMHASGFFRNHILFLLGLLMLIGGLGVYLSKKAIVRLFLSNLILKLPLIGRMVLHLQMARLAAGLGMLMEAKVPLDQALDLVQEMMGFAPLRAVIPRIHQAVIQGSSFNEAVKKEKIFPISFVQMIQVGEKTARTDEMLDHYAKATEEEAEVQLNQLTQLLEPMLILTLGGLVALILVAMYLPMFELSSVMG